MKKTIKNITINYENEASSFIDEIFNYLIQELDYIHSFFRINLENEINITIIPTKKELDTTYWNNPNVEPKPWVVGFINNYNNNLEIFLLSPNDYKSTPHKQINIEDYKKTLIHEYVHIVHTVLCNGNYPKDFIWEGVATYLSHQYPNREKITATKEEILNGTCDFNQFASLFEMIINNYNQETIIKILRNEIDGEIILDELIKINNKSLI